MERLLPVWSRRLKLERVQRWWSQERVAQHIDVSPKTVGRWERGEVFPSLEYRSRLCGLYGKTEVELGFIEEEATLQLQGHEGGYGEINILPPAANDSFCIDWGEAPYIEQLYGRERECAQLERWIVFDRSHVIAILGTGGIGKTVLAVKVALQTQHAFDYVFWRSLYNAPTLENILQKCLLFLSNNQQIRLPNEMEDQISLLITFLRKQPCLLVLDNVEAILQGGEETGHWREGYEGYGRLIRRIGEAQHRSCLVLTSREKPKEVAQAEGIASPIRSLQLSGLELADGREVLRDTGLFGSDDTWRALISLYSGIPLALKIVAGTIREVFGGNITRFLKEGMAVFGDVEDLLDQQFHRLSVVEQQVMYWLAIEREAISLDALRENLVRPVSKGALLKALDSLRRRFMIETSNTIYFTLQPVIMEYVTDKLTEQVYREIDSEEPRFLATYTLMKAQAKDYVRDSQVRLMLTPVMQQLLDIIGKEELEKKVKRMLSALRGMSSHKPSYTAGNLLNLLILMQSDLRGYDFSGLYIRQVYLQGMSLPEVDFTHSHLVGSIFTDTFGEIFSVAFSPNGALLAAGTAINEVRIWQVTDSRLLFVRKEHIDWVWSVAFSPDELVLASGSEDQTIRLWEVSTGRCLRTLQGHVNRVKSVAFSPNGLVLASGSEDQTIRLWEVSTGRCLHILQGHTDWVESVAFNPRNGNVLVSGSKDQTILVWDISTRRCLKTLRGHTGGVKSIAFTLDGNLLASGSEDQTIRLWDMSIDQGLNILQAHSSGIESIAFSPDGKFLASGSNDQTVRLWDVNTGYCRNTLRGSSRIRSVAFHPEGKMLASGDGSRNIQLWDVDTGYRLNTLQGYTNGVISIAFSPDGCVLVSGSEDHSIRLWDVHSGSCLKALQGHTGWVRTVAMSTDGRLLASGSDDRTIRLWDVHSGSCLKTLQEHTLWIHNVTFSPDGLFFASASEDRAIRLWDSRTDHCIKTLQGHTDRVRSIAFSPDGLLLASGSEDHTIRLWNLQTGLCLSTLCGHTDWVRSVAFSPDGQILASGSRDCTIRLWEVSTGHCLKTLQGHASDSWIRSVAFSPDGQILASSSTDQDIWLWDVNTGSHLKILRGHTDWIRSVAFSPDGSVLASGSKDGTIKFWNVQEGTCLKTLVNERPYEHMKITDVTGLTEAQKASLKALGAAEDEDVE